MEGILSKETFLQIYHLLNTVEHVPYDCGSLCNKACCSTGDTEMGIYLLPNEHLVLQEEKKWFTWEKQLAREYDFPGSWQGYTYFLSCKGKCSRKKRPIQCRTFPLAPYLTPEGRLQLIWETLVLPYTCPLLVNKEPLQKMFIINLMKAWQLLISDPLIKDLVEYDSRSRETEGAIIQVVYP